VSVEEIRKICLSFRGVTEDIKWENHLCFNIGDKMFVVTSPDNVPQTASFKASDEDFLELTSRKGFIPAPYLARYKWVFVEDIGLMNKKQWQTCLRSAYELIAEKLPKAKKKQLGLG
jgi:predicted DNA-binding protein (MmcQ/YjbR family)